MKIIGLIGFIGSGKGTAGDILRDCGYIQDSFAAGVKDACTAIFGWERRLLEGDTTDSRAFREAIDPYWSHALGRPDFTPRTALQLMGTEAGRSVFGPNLWVSALFNRMQTDKNYVITDARFPNELQAIKEHGGKNIWIQRGPNPDWYDTAFDINTDPPNGREIKGVHISEWAWVGSPHIHTIITNNGTIQQLKNALTMLLSQD